MFHVIYNVIPHNIIVYNILLQHDYIALSDTDTIYYIQHYIICYIVDGYYNIALNVTK